MVRGRTGGATDSRGMFSLYARHHDTITFTCMGYKEYSMTVHDTLRRKRIYYRHLPQQRHTDDRGGGGDTQDWKHQG
ncbi:MAG: carboxypeptidase-like regulatory domain-containing protein [Marinilabiliales bacterium]|nr:carboxypeptidase-like regulatory domain-containing protein [Marinilabiliales bacterium]